MSLKIATLLLLTLAICCQADGDQGAVRLKRLQERSLLTSNRIISFNKADFEYLLPDPDNTS